MTNATASVTEEDKLWSQFDWSVENKNPATLRNNIAMALELSRSRYTKLNSTNSTQCRVGDYILVLIDLINVLIPAILMSIFTIVLIVSIHRMRTRMLQTFKSESNKVLRKKIQLIVALVSMNISYLVLSLPWNIYGLFQVKGLIFEFLIYLFSISFACNFYFLLAANDYFRNEFFRMIYFKK